MDNTRENIMEIDYYYKTKRKTKNGNKKDIILFIENKKWGGFRNEKTKE